jgi:hypothetical protein
MDLSHINASQHNRGVNGKLDIKKERLFLRDTYAAADVNRKDRRVALGLPANPCQLPTGLIQRNDFHGGSGTIGCVAESVVMRERPEDGDAKNRCHTPVHDCGLGLDSLGG